MRTACIAGAATLVLAGIAATDLAGQAGSSQRAPRSYTSTSTAILVDVVVRDRRGRPVTDLSAADFEVAEDGVHQKIDSFTRVSRGGGIGVGVAWRTPRALAAGSGTSGAAPDAADASSQDATTALVFDHLSAETLRLAQKATLDYVPLTGDSGVQVGVFTTEAGVRAVQRYTSDRAAVRRAVGSLLPVGGADEEQRAARADELTSQRRALSGEAASAGASVVAGAGAVVAQNASEIGERESELLLIQTELNLLRSIDNFDRGHKGYDTSTSLMAVVQSLADYPGRKTVVFFSEGLPVSPALSAKVDAVIDAANRANITVYAVDTRGLRAKSTNEKARNELQTFSEERLAQVGAGMDRTDQPLSMAMERVEDTLKLDSHSGLARLSGETGGFLVEGSNDLSAAFRRIDEDGQFHYLLSYAPTNDAYDGTFRAIRVKVGRPGIQVFARKGYRALHARPAADADARELAALALLNRHPLPNAFPVQASGFSFPDPARPGLSPLLVQLSTSSLRFDVDQAHSTYAAQATVVVRLRDGEGHTVQTLSQQYSLTGDARDVEAARQGHILFYREPDLLPGVYTVESIVLDEMTREGAVRLSTLTVPGVVSGKLGMSSLVLVGRAEEMRSAHQAESAPSGPLYVGQTLLYPNLGEPIRKSAASELAFYFALYGELQGVTANAELLRNGQLLAVAPVVLPRVTGAHAQHVGHLPVSGLPGGTYELRIRVTGAGPELSRTAYFTLID
jgi:VWFA-related protein